MIDSTLKNKSFQILKKGSVAIFKHGKQGG